MTEKPKRGTVKLRGHGIPYPLVCCATWGATILGYFPKWFSDAVYDAVFYLINLVKDVLN